MSYPSSKIPPDTSWCLSVPDAESVGKSFYSKVGMMFLGPSDVYKVYIDPIDYLTSHHFPPKCVPCPYTVSPVSRTKFNVTPETVRIFSVPWVTRKKKLKNF